MFTVVVRPWIRIASFGLMVLVGLIAGLPAANAQKRIPQGEQPLIDEFPVRKAGTALGESVRSEAAADEEAPPRSVPSFPRPSVKEAKILRILDSSRAVNWKGKSLEDALNELEERTGLEIWINKQALQDEGISTDQQITLVLKKIPLKKCLQLVLEPLALTYVVEDEVLKITTQTKSDESVTTRVYPVGDLFDTPAEGKEFLETIECGLGRTRGLLAVSSRMKTLTVRDSRVVQERVQELLLALRDAQQNPAPDEKY